MGIRSGINAGDRVELPVTTLELYSYSMADMKSSAGRYEINWSDLDQLQYFDEGVFYESDLGGDILLDQAVRICLIMCSEAAVKLPICR